jgi:hypothetical protein
MAAVIMHWPLATAAEAVEKAVVQVEAKAVRVNPVCRKVNVSAIHEREDAKMEAVVPMLTLTLRTVKITVVVEKEQLVEKGRRILLGAVLVAGVAQSIVEGLRVRAREGLATFGKRELARTVTIADLIIRRIACISKRVPVAGENLAGIAILNPKRRHILLDPSIQLRRALPLLRRRVRSNEIGAQSSNR